jgi:hypothetical protein
VPEQKPYPSPPLLTYGYAPKDVKKASDAKFGHSLETILSLAPETLKPDSQHALLVDGVPTPFLELAIVMLNVVMMRQAGGNTAAMAAGIGGGAAAAAGSAAAAG